MSDEKVERDVERCHVAGRPSSTALRRPAKMATISWHVPYMMKLSERQPMPRGGVR